MKKVIFGLIALSIGIMSSRAFAMEGSEGYDFKVLVPQDTTYDLTKNPDALMRFWSEQRTMERHREQQAQERTREFAKKQRQIERIEQKKQELAAQQQAQARKEQMQREMAEKKRELAQEQAERKRQLAQEQAVLDRLKREAESALRTQELEKKGEEKRKIRAQEHRQQQEKREFEMEHLGEVKEEERKGTAEKIKLMFEETAKMLNDGKSVRTIALATGLTIAGVLAVKHALPIIQKKAEEYLFTPPLIDDSSFTGFAGYFTKKSLPDQKIVNLYFNPKLKQQVDRIISVLKNTSKNKGYYLNYLFYGEPGTGKTATARALAYESGMDYAIMSGGNVQKLLASGKAEEKMKDVFKWAKGSKKGMIFFIDEADAFLKDPNKYAMTDELYAVLNSFLNMTGTESRDIAIIMSTNHPHNLPKAVLDRVGPGQYVYFGLPQYPERARIARHFVDKYLGKYFYNDVSAGEAPGINEQLKDEIIEYIAQKTDKFSGRNISYLILAIEKALQAEGHDRVTKKLIDEIVEQAVEQQQAAQTFGTFA